MIARLTTVYLAIFALVLAVLSIAAYAFVQGQYHSLLLPALGTPEGKLALASVMRRVALTIAGFDVPLLLFVGFAAWLLARLSLRPLLAARERERAFVADAAHQLRSPLATIASVAQAEQNAAHPPSTQQALGLIASTALDASALIGDLLTLARTPEARLLSREPVDLAAVATLCIQEFQPRAAAANLSLEAEVASAIVDGDARRLRELMRNLLENALLHARSLIRIRCAALAGAAVFQVADDGAGVDRLERDRIFERFFRGSDSQGGSGLGLAIARWVANAHEGTLALDETASGASFTLRLPLLR